jgi:hypothetical protein
MSKEFENSNGWSGLSSAIPSNFFGPSCLCGNKHTQVNVQKLQAMGVL